MTTQELIDAAIGYLQHLPPLTVDFRADLIRDLVEILRQEKARADAAEQERDVTRLRALSAEGLVGMSQRRADAAEANSKTLIQLEVAYRESERLMLRRLSDALTGGAAGTWEEIIHAAEATADLAPDAKNKQEPQMPFENCTFENNNSGYGIRVDNTALPVIEAQMRDRANDMRDLAAFGLEVYWSDLVEDAAELLDAGADAVEKRKVAEARADAAEQERDKLRAYEHAVQEVHAICDRAGIPSAMGEPCDDPECNTLSGHRVRQLVARVDAAEERAREYG